jgi:hypothetical protein
MELSVTFHVLTDTRDNGFHVHMRYLDSWRFHSYLKNKRGAKVNVLSHVWGYAWQKVTGSSSDNWIYWHFGYSLSINYN